MAETVIRAFLFSDLVGSSAMWEADAAAMSQAVARHDALVSAAVDGAGGRIFKHTGDGFCAVFGDPGSALVAAAAVQRSLADEEVDARMAIHAGAAEERDGDFFGPTLNRCARVMACGHGGQVLVTGAVAELVGSDLGSEVKLVDLGAHKLRGLDRSERIFQASITGLPDTFGPLRSEERGLRLRLPQPRNRFFGRDEALARLADLLQRERIVTLTGVGGCGKTRLAIEAARRRGLGLSDGAAFVDLVPVREVDLIDEAVANALAIPLQSERPTGAQIIDYLEGKSIVLVLDNCEHILDDAAALAERVLDGCPEVAVLATSREPLGIDGEHVLRVGSLGLPAGGDDPRHAEAVQFFAERASAADSSFDLDHHVTAVVEICKHLDGVPLALELAAARVRYDAPEELAAQLDDRFRLLAGGPRRLARQQTLQATMDWSYDLLTPAEQRAFRRAGVFVGSFSREAFEGVCVDGADGRRVLESLVDKSLLENVESGSKARFRALETARIYALEKLMAGGELGAVRRTHREFFVDLCRRWQPPNAEPVFVIDAAHAEVDNLTAALFEAEEAADAEAMCLLIEALGPVWMLLTRQEEGRRWIERIRPMEESLDLPRRTGWRATSIYVDWAAAQLGVGHADAIDALQLDPQGETDGALMATYFRAGMEAYFGPDSTLQLFDRIRAMPAFARRAELGHLLTYAEGTTLLMAGSLDAAEVRLRAARSASADTPFWETWDRLVLATVLHLRGRNEEAVAEARTAADGVAEDALYMQDLLASAILANVLTGVDDIGAAAGQLRRSLEILDHRYTHMPRVAGIPAAAAAWIELVSGDVTAAAELVAATEALELNYRSETTFALIKGAHARAKSALGEDEWRATRQRARRWDHARHIDEVRRIASAH